MSNKVIITVAPTGSIPTREDNPNIPYTAEEVAAETRRSYEAGASVVHLHARHPDTGKPTPDLAVFRDYLAAVRDACPIITQITTGGGATTLGLSVEDRLKPVEELRPDSASLNAGSMNFGRGLFPNTPDTMELYAKRMREWGVMPEFEVYDLSMIQNMEHWIRKPGLLEPPFRVSFVLGVMGGIPASLKNLVLLKEALDPSYSWQAIGIGRHQFPLGTGALILGGGMRVGFEDNVYLSKGVPAKSNAELVAKAVRIARELGLEPASVDEARQMLPLLNRG
ncbi:MAG: 3-keto-5-aminohexanoate cleavage protein [Proteobacteria bacterium]|nr:3-keto-5-aminohexanoate cleavage protein [Pseudomonadota bacterium]MBU4381630.1 3-keto-5-aminohexanoate cleavage protein [Pseudomonadota bacterium]MBU4605756.1 3-keto-5-aminohexanoate cleavage protein [Pseudomonadota bacterium]MCG2766617.1 3-keto-5-aminohexanoate cleavage protein [Desulfarculaceae bacterium]